ncbi:ATP-dependent nuclease [Pigmentiphaga litoralis]|uniref:ATP-dependent nuclease n=1 Tax=Pigmentiphaga litoralis TaxID=516702 RepID=UPI003B438406
MPRINKFFIENFKGIENVEIDLEGKATSPVLTLIGLNESGKTTILEALSHFVTGDRSVASLFDGPYAKATGLSLIPMHRKAAYSGKIRVGAEISLIEKDIEGLQALAKKFSLVLDPAPLMTPITATRTFSFEDSTLKGTKNIWALPLMVRKARGKNFEVYKRPTDSDQDDFWSESVDFVQDRLQQVSYFPTFLVDMPARIYLQEHQGETAQNRHYRFVLQDILDSLHESLSLEKHVAKRIEDYKESQKSATWLSMLFGSASKTPIDSVFQKISSAITKEVIGSWQRVFQRAISAKSISIDWNVDAEKGDLPYATFHVSDGESKYAINERSLGFRWFFSFLLFTGFKKGKERKTIFIFDEPAANLHAKAQAELLTSFSKIASDENKIIYSTHSHHMINPRWLGAAFIIENAALDYDSSDNFGLDTKPTNITATPYRQFVSSFPTRSSYFQPVIEKLEYVSPEIIGSAPYLIVEGISDYYALTLAMRISGRIYSFNVLPGTGSGALGPVLSQLMAQGQNFAMLLDDDAEGRKAAAKYAEDWFIGGDRLSTLRDVDASFGGLAIEKLLGQEFVELVRAHYQTSAKPSKKQVGWFLAESCAAPGDVADRLPLTTVGSLRKILDFYEAFFTRQPTRL